MKPNKASLNGRGATENDSDFDETVDNEESEDNSEESLDEEESDEDEDDEEIEGEESELSFESNDDEQEEQSSQPKKNLVKKQVQSKKGETTVSKNENTSKESEVGKLLRIKKPESNAAESFKNELNKSDSSNKEQADEYEHDTDDEEDIRNTVGNIPMHWYDEYKHIGYDWDAKKIIKPAKRDQLDDFLKRMEDPDFWRTVKDPQTGQDVVLSEADIDLIKRINSQRIPDSNYDDYTVSAFAANTVRGLCWMIFFFIAAMGRLVYIGSGENAD